MQPTQHQPPGIIEEMKQGFNWVHAFALMASVHVTLMTTQLGSWGRRYVGIHFLLGLLFWPMLFVAFYGPHRQAGAMLFVWQAGIALFVIHLVVGGVKRLAGRCEHSLYWGDSLCERVISNPRTARFFDNLIVITAGGYVHLQWNKPLGAFFMVSALAKFFSDSMVWHARDARLRQMNDAKIENAMMIELFRQQQQR